MFAGVRWVRGKCTPVISGYTSCTIGILLTVWHLIGQSDDWLKLSRMLVYSLGYPELVRVVNDNHGRAANQDVSFQDSYIGAGDGETVAHMNGNLTERDIRGPYIPLRWIVNRELTANGTAGNCKACFGRGCKTAPIASGSHGSDDSSGKNSALHIFDVVCIESRLMTAHLPVDRALLCMIDGRLQLKRKAGFDKGRAFYCTIQHCDISHRRVFWSLLSRQPSACSFVVK